MLKKRLISIVKKRPSGTEAYVAPSRETDFLKKLEKIKTKADEKELESIKYPYADLPQKIKLYKHITSGVSLQWFIEDSLMKKGEINYCGHADFCQAFKSSAYPGVSFTFSSNTQKPAFSRFDTIYGKSDYEYMSRYLDLKGVLFEIQIGLPKNIDQKIIFNKLCKDYPQIKPIFKREDRNRNVGGCVLKTKGGRYIWENDAIYVSFTFADYGGVTGSNPYLVNRLKEEGKNFGVRSILIKDKKMIERFVTTKKASAQKAANAAQKAAQDAALDF